MSIHPNSSKRAVAACVAVIGVLSSFDFFTPNQATAISALIAALAAVWHPKHR